MIIFISIILIWFLLFAYNQIDLTLWQTKFWYFYKFELSNLERTNLIIVFINILIIFVLFINFISLKYHKKPRKNIKKFKQNPKSIAKVVNAKNKLPKRKDISKPKQKQ